MDQNSGSTKGVVWIIVVIVVIIIAGYLIYKYSAIRPTPQTSPNIPTQTNQVPPTNTGGAVTGSPSGSGTVQTPPVSGGNGGTGATGSASMPADMNMGTQSASYPAAPIPASAPQGSAPTPIQ